MDHPADSTVKMYQGGKGRYVDREGIPYASEWMCLDALVFRTR